MKVLFCTDVHGSTVRFKNINAAAFYWREYFDRGRGQMTMNVAMQEFTGTCAGGAAARSLQAQGLTHPLDQEE
ncbi:MAG: hypothetical protein ACHQ50_15475 [Fimbriimonadales bacterium]